ncbi:MAG: hypothetical protein ACD_31C00005G0004 [uncultured bacterium]|uniref:Tetratricopeptide TPR_2 repeat protein n=3 Tax=Candidatus Daviesiibacteriota TaxID=1752718 RepID=A0A0G0HU16_9BACT|nr:MAG: hypothetical protein ACD_31C00005G0004 [uncultured bacterium]KKQ07386.1 MAG: Tetratricopeptide TPR_2 repeat protein [Candidatus Daviesbacteria bacterium GW2011_GWB1_36_5]KKQ15708.1 MAG: Tetratricopeptide TPR_2 repeat protein [Candidatus Daviesbacteria bacterium GW2011_GWA1_36_8]OGE17872.1 MAG: hypothetical protein A2858_03955 [Candidatus Daviesbacteria bacterium RIFCSPHIGHO2_01_FULL_36_37]
MKRADIVFGILLTIILLLINWQAVNSYFSQDDFFHLRQVLDKNFFDLPKFFLPWNDLGYAFYRPLSREVLGFFMYNLFGLNPFPYHLLNMTVILLIGMLLYRLVGLWVENKFVQLIAVMFYILSAVHNVELYYLSSIQTLLASMFSLVSLINYSKYLMNGERRNYFISVVFFLFGLFSHESAVVTLAIIALFRVFFEKELNLGISVKVFNDLKWFLGVALFRVIIYLFITQLPREAVYAPSFLLKNILNTTSWYVLWVIGLPEMLVDFMTLTLSFNPNFFKWYPNYAYFAFPALSVFILAFIYFAITSKKVFLSKNLILFVLAFFVSLLPYIFFPMHKFIYYLSLPSVFFSAALGILIGSNFRDNKKERLILFISFLSFTIVSFNTALINKDTYWASKRAKAAQVLVSKTKKEYPSPPKNSVFFIKNDPNYPEISEEWGSSSKQAFYILSGSDAFQLIYKDPSINVLYEDVDNNVKGVEYGSYYTLNATFPY